MQDFFDFFLYFIGKAVSFLLSISLGLGFTYGEAMIGLTVLSVLITALVVRYHREKVS